MFHVFSKGERDMSYPLEGHKHFRREEQEPTHCFFKGNKQIYPQGVQNVQMLDKSQ